MIIQLDYNKDELNKASANYITDIRCFEVELIKNRAGHDTKYRIEFIDNNYIDISIRELAILKRILNNDVVTRKLNLDMNIN